MIIILDETVFHPDFEIVVNLREGSKMGYVGGFKGEDEDHSYVPSPATPSDLSPEKLAKMSQHFVITRCDSNKYTFQVDVLPRQPRPKGGQETMAGAAQTLIEYGNLFKAAAFANSGVPPIGGAWDGGSPNAQINGLFLGILPSSQMKVPFFAECHKRKMDLPRWAYAALFASEHVITGNNDSRHVMKRFSTHMCSGTRDIRWGAYLITLAPMVKCGLPVRSLACEDSQSDLDYAKRMSAGYTEPTWCCLPCVIPQFCCALITSAWSGAKAFTLRESLANCLQGYYMLLLQTSQAKKKHGKAWSKTWLPVQNLRSLLDLVGHFTICARHWPEDVPWLPHCREEHTIEQFFSRVKGYNRGNCTMKDGLLGAQLTHAKEFQDSSIFENPKARMEKPVSAEELSDIAKASLRDAVTFQAGQGRR